MRRRRRRFQRRLLVGYVTVDVFVAIGCITGVECISFLGEGRWLKTRRTGLSSRALLMF